MLSLASERLKISKQRQKHRLLPRFFSIHFFFPDSTDINYVVGVIRYVLAVFCVFSPSALWFDSVPSRLNLLGVRGNLKRKVENNPRKVV